MSVCCCVAGLLLGVGLIEDIVRLKFGCWLLAHQHTPQFLECCSEQRFREVVRAVVFGGDVDGFYRAFLRLLNEELVFHFNMPCSVLDGLVYCHEDRRLVVNHDHDRLWIVPTDFSE